MQSFIVILLHKENCYHKVITEHLAINMESAHDRFNCDYVCYKKKKRKDSMMKPNNRVTNSHTDMERK